jgi:hypothetical protein
MPLLQSYNQLENDLCLELYESLFIIEEKNETLLNYCHCTSYKIRNFLNFSEIIELELIIEERTQKIKLMFGSELNFLIFIDSSGFLKSI